MTPGGASQAARELVKAYIENQQIHWATMSHEATGKDMADMLIAMHEKLAAYFEKTG
jgi:hypothetical protein